MLSWDEEVKPSVQSIGAMPHGRPVELPSTSPTAARMLDDLGIESVRLMSNNPEKGRQLEAYGIAIEGYEPLVVGLGAYNTGYLDVKRDRMGHQLPGGTAQNNEIPEKKVTSK
jgi:3,4-dihydroxy 2-butanone 4-phosphate synthase/GTP cyclohydrolase II